MSRALLSSLLACAVLAACGGGTDSPHDVADCNLSTALPADTGAPPRDILDLHHWSLTIPVDANGGTSGTADTVSTTELLDGYKSEWFYSADGGGVTFWAPVDGALTPRSQFARSELRELVDPANEGTNWFVGDDAVMTATVAVNRVPVSNGNAKVIVGKIVQYSDPSSSDNPDTHFLAHLIYHVHANTCTAELYALVNQSPSGDNQVEHYTLIDDGLQLNHSFPIKMEVHQGVLTLSSGPHVATVPINAAWNNLPVYFRAGAGLNTRATDSSDGGAVTIFDLTVTH